MPMDHVGVPMQAPPSEDWGLNRVPIWRLKLCLIPKKCFLSNKQLWGKYAYYGENWITGPGDPVVQEFWVSKEEYIVWKLTQ